MTADQVRIISKEPRVIPPRRSVRFAALALVLGLGGAVLAATPAQAVDFTVTSSADSGAGSLREALTAAASGDRILFDPSVTSIVLESSIDIPHGVHIDGPGSQLLTISRVGGGGFWQLGLRPAIADQDYVIEGVTLDGSGSTGVAIYASYSDENELARDITLRDVVVHDHSSGPGGAALYTYQTVGDILIEDSLFQNNAGGADGGALRLDELHGSLTVRSSAFIQNDSDVDGGAMWLNPVYGTVSIESSLFAGNTASLGGAIYNSLVLDAFSITDSVFESNEAISGSGGAVYVANATAGALTVTRSSFLGNTATNDSFVFGGAIAAEIPALTIDSSTFAGNALTNGGFGTSVAAGVHGPTTIVNSTFDEAGVDEYALYFEGTSGAQTPTLDIAHSTIVAPGGLFVQTNESIVTVDHSIIQSSEPAVTVVSGAPVTVTRSILSTPLDSDIVDGGSNRFETDALLAPLADNGGPTLTRLPGAASPAINGGDPAITGAPEFDQRGPGFPRIVGVIDIGAVESPQSSLAATGVGTAWWIVALGLGLLLAGAAVIRASRRVAVGAGH